VPCNIESRQSETEMITLPYSLVIEATDDPDFFGFYSPDLEGFTGVGHSIEDCVYKARSGMAHHVETMRQQALQVPARNPNPTIVIQNEQKLQPA
jgi:predicted RNase H-like HicB family nuclease